MLCVKTLESTVDKLNTDCIKKNPHNWMCIVEARNGSDAQMFKSTLSVYMCVCVCACVRVGDCVCAGIYF